MGGACKGQTKTSCAMVEGVEEGDGEAPHPCSQELVSPTRELPKLKGKHDDGRVGGELVLQEFPQLRCSQELVSSTRGIMKLTSG